MKRIYVIVLAAAFSASILSCQEKSSEKLNEAGDSIKKTIETESEKTTKNGSDAH